MAGRSQQKPAKHMGKFTICPGIDVSGELRLKGRNTALRFHHTHDIDLLKIPEGCIKGVLHGQTKASLIRCIQDSKQLLTGSIGHDGYLSASIFPHFVLLGPQHLGPTEKSITSIHFVIDDASTLFYDFDAFGGVLDAGPLIEPLIEASSKRAGRKIAVGPHPMIVYFSGKREIISTQTCIGSISVRHRPGFGLRGPKGCGFKNVIGATITFNEPTTFDTSIDRLLTLVSFFGTLVGRQQNILELSISLPGKSDLPDSLDVHWSMPPRRKRSTERKPHCADVLLDAVRRPEEFSRVLENWVQRHTEWEDARNRFFGSFGRAHRYTTDRLIAAANMFDILPQSAVPKDVSLPADLQAAKTRCEEIFKQLPRSAERDSVLSSLGRLGKSVLKHKIRHRAKAVIDAFGSHVPDLSIVINEAVNCRNYYVHGGLRSFDYQKYPLVTAFFTDTLEFVFATSDLIEAGWDINAWRAKGTTMSHPFGTYWALYAERLAQLKSALTDK